MSEITELSEQDFARGIRSSVRKRLIHGRLESGSDVAALRRFIGLSREEFSLALGVSVRTVRRWESDQVRPRGTALVLLRIAARHPRVILECLPGGL